MNIHELIFRGATVVCSIATGITAVFYTGLGGVVLAIITGAIGMVAGHIISKRD